MGISRDWRHKRRATGGKRKAYRKKRKFEMGRPAANTKIGEKRIRLVRTRGGNTKYRALRLETGNFSWGSEAVTRKSRILNVVYNASNNELVRTNTLVKSCIIQVDATPFRLHYEQYYGVAPGKKRRIVERVTKRPKKIEKAASDKAGAKGAASKAPAKAGVKDAAAAKKGASKAKAAAKGAAKKGAAKAKAPAKAGDKAIAKSSSKKVAAKAKAPAKAGEKAEKAPAKAADKAPAKDADKAPAKDADKAPAKAAAKVAKVSKAPKPKEADPSKPARISRRSALEAKKKAKLLIKRKLQTSHRKATGKLAENIIEQFSTGKLLVCVSSRPGQSGRCDGYILEGKELDFYMRKIAQKKKAK